VSALIHAATMVTAGVYVVARTHVLFLHAPTAMLVVAVTGCVTAFFAATIGLVQTDIKKVLAYSTVSQLGYMFLACGVGAFTAGIFHLMTHAFFKALLFLAAGSAIHAMGGEQDLRKMGGLRKQIPWTYWTMLMGTLAIVGAPGFSGFFSKDSILFHAFESETGGRWLYGLGLFSALLTAFYMFRLIFLGFHGAPRFDGGKVHVHESPKNMLGPLVVLGVLSVMGGWLAAPTFFGGVDRFEEFLGPAMGQARAVGNAAESKPLEVQLAAVAVGIALAGFLAAGWFYLRRRDTPERLAKSFSGAYALLLNKYYVDEIYAAILVKPLVWISTRVLWNAVDEGAIDGSVNGLADGAQAVGGRLRRVESGNTRSYAAWVVVGAILFIAMVLWPTLKPPRGMGN
jgi:NADH-quinone oxidoreductase subunit L